MPFSAWMSDFVIKERALVLAEIPERKRELSLIQTIIVP
jgi:hypothetical protein